MARPVISNNSPSPGSIAWTTFKVRYGNGDGTGGTVAVNDYTVNASNTDKLFTWWRFNNGSPTVESSNSIPDGLSGSFLSNSSLEVPDLTDATLPESWIRNAWSGYTTGGAGAVHAVGAGYAGGNCFQLTTQTAGTAPSPSVGSASFTTTPTETLYLALKHKRTGTALTTYAALVNPTTGAEIVRFTGVNPATPTTAWSRITGSAVVPAGITTARLAILSYNGAVNDVLYLDDIVLSRTAIPNELGPDDQLLFLNKSGIGIFAESTNVLDGSLLVTGSVLADGIGANQITAVKIRSTTLETRHFKADQIEGNAIKANQISANHIIAGAISAEKLSIGAMSSNLCPNPFFEDWLVGATMPQKWAQIGGTGFSGTITRETALTLSGSISLSMTAAASNTAAITPTDYIPVIPDVSVFATGYYAGIQTSGVITNGAAIAIYYYDASYAYISSGSQQQDITGNSTIQAVQYVGTSPSNAKYMRPVLLSSSTQKVYWDNIEIGNRIVGVSIADGAIDGKLITGATLQTASSGQRIVIRNDGSGGIIEGYSGVPSELLPGYLDPSMYGGMFPCVGVRPGTATGYAGRPEMLLYSTAAANGTNGAGGYVNSRANNILFSGNSQVKLFSYTSVVLDAPTTEITGNLTFANPQIARQTGGSVALTTTPTAVTNCSITVTSTGTSDKYEITGVFDFLVSTGNGALICEGFLYTDGTQNTAAQAFFYGPTTFMRSLVSQVWIVTNLAAGSHTFVLRVSKSTAVGVASVAPQTSIYVKRVV